jgi:predicted unusual protein kinase regulating ubiquinone biosynthesis (AarF/ABC1/UbiB family)
MEKKLVKVLETMIKAGIIHQDCHPGNIGILKDGRVVLFDFGFAIFSSEKMSQPETILMSQLYMVLEHYDKKIMYDSYLYDVIYQIRQNKYKIA